MDNQTLLTTEETAKLLNVKMSWLRSAIFRRAIPYIKVGQLVRFRERDLKAWLEKHTVEMRQ